MIVAVGSRNKIKINAVRTSLSRVYPDITVREVAVQSSVSPQPWGDDEIIHGAIHRAQKALEMTKADLGVGLESGTVRKEIELEPGLIQERYFTNAWCAVCDTNGQISLGGGFNVELPPQVAQDIVEAGLDLGQAMSKVPTPRDHSAVGAIGVLTDTLLDRQTAYESIVLCATARYIRDDLYCKTQEVGGQGCQPTNRK
jgi:inosine/xanthosine triphosphatase